MAQVVSELPLTLESSTQLTRPDARLLTNMDANTGETSITEYTLQRSRTQMNLPCTSGPRDYHVSCCDQQVQRRLSSASPTKKRIEFSVLDPITGFLSPAGENLLRVQGRMPSLGKARLEPQHLVPQSAHTIRTQPEAIDELKRSHEGDADPELKWNSQK